MSGARQRWVGVGVAVALVATALWVLQRPSSRARDPEATERRASLASPGDLEPGSPGRRHTLAPREISVPGHGWVRGQVVDEDGMPLTEGQVVLWCLGTDDSVSRLRDGVLSLDEDGHFEGPGCRGQVCPELRHPFMVPAEPWSLRSGPLQTPRGAVPVSVVGEGGRPLGGTGGGGSAGDLHGCGR